MSEHTEDRFLQGKRFEAIAAEHQTQDTFRIETQFSRQRTEQTVEHQLGINLNMHRILKDVLDTEERRVEGKVPQERIHRVMRWLHPPEWPKIRETKWEEGTCEWILTHPSYKAWTRSNHSKPLWVHGIPGCGKSVMATFLSHKATTNLIFTHYFDNSANRYSNLATPFVIALMAQILESDSVQAGPQFPTIVGTILPLFDHFKSAAECPFHKLWPLVQVMLETIPGSFTLIVDALDECHDPDHSDDLLKHLTALSTLTNGRVILLSRYHVSLNHLLGEAEKIAMDSASVTPDISIYVNREIDRTVTLQSLRHPIVEKALKASHGMFLWAKMMLDYLKRARSQNVQLRRLEHFPAGLARVYERLLSEVAAGLDHEELTLRRSIFLLLLGASRPLTLEELSFFLALRCPSGTMDDKDLLLDPKGEVLRLCWPLVLVVDDYVQLTHMSVKEFLIAAPQKNVTSENTASPAVGVLHLTLRESNALLARKCFSKLSQGHYKIPNRIAPLLRSNLKITAAGHEPGPNYDDVGYDYASHYWHTHLRAVSTPTQQLLQQAQKFLIGFEFVTWSEVLTLLGDNKDFSTAINIRIDLESWVSLLPPDLRAIVPLRQYLDLPYRSLTTHYNEDGGDGLLPILCKARLGEYWSLSGGLDDAYDLIKDVADGFKELLGEKNPLTLRAESKVFIQYSWMNRWQEAFDGLSKVAQLQHEVVGEDVSDYYFTLEYAAWANYSLTNFHDSTQDQARAAAGLFRTIGPTDQESLRSQMFQGWTLERQGLIEQALYLYEDVWRLWTAMTDPENPMSQMVQKSIVSVHWKKGELQRAEILMLENFVARQRTFTIKSFVTIDSGCQLAVIYREMKRPQEAQAILDLLGEDDALTEEYERFCQSEHLRALLEFDRDDFGAAHDRLQSLLHQASSKGRESNNRELLWLRLNLADMLREHGRPQEALSLFDDIVRPLSGDSDSDQSLAEEPDTPQQLRLAEEALRQVRRAESIEADRLLQDSGLEWVRKQDFWIVFGGPITDTAAMKLHT